MTGLVIALVLALLAAAALYPAVGRRAFAMVAGALALGLAGYAGQGAPGLPGAPGHPIAERTHARAAPDDRDNWMSGLGEDGRWLIMADAIGRSGDARGAAEIIQSGLRQQPRSPLLWLALGNALVGYTDGVVSPAAELAFARATALDPASPAPPLFLAMALAQSGQIARADAILTALLARTPPDAPYRGDLQRRLAAIRALAAM